MALSGQPEVHTPLLIGDPGQLRAFAATRAFASRQPLILAIPGIPPPEAIAIGERLNKDRAACGCGLGAQAMAAAFVAVLALLMLRYGPFTLATLARLPIAIVVAIVCAGLGKAYGVTSARRRARREVDRILGLFAARQ